MMQQSQVAATAIDPQQPQHQQELMMMLVPPQAEFSSQPQVEPQPQLIKRSYPQEQQVSSADEISTLWIGGLQHWMDETDLHNCFASTQDLISVKVIRNKGYSFLKFASHAAAEMALQNYNGLQMPHAEQFYRLDWATFGVGEKRSEEYTIFVGDLASDVIDNLLQETFRAKYPSVKGAKVVNDRATGHSKGYGFVKFGDDGEQARAMAEMNGTFCSSRRIRRGPALKKNATVYQQTYPDVVALASASENDPNNKTLFVGGLDPTVTNEMLMQSFGQFGEIVHVKLPVGKFCGFVEFSKRASAEAALQSLRGTIQKPIRLSWGRCPANKQVQQLDPNQWNGWLQIQPPTPDPNQPNGWFQNQQPDPNQWNEAYYNDVQRYNADYGYTIQFQYPNMSSYTPPNGYYQQR